MRTSSVLLFCLPQCSRLNQSSWPPPAAREIGKSMSLWNGAGEDGWLRLIMFHHLNLAPLLSQITPGLHQQEKGVKQWILSWLLTACHSMVQLTWQIFLVICHVCILWWDGMWMFPGCAQTLQIPADSSSASQNFHSLSLLLHPHPPEKESAQTKWFSRA